MGRLHWKKHPREPPRACGTSLASWFFLYGGAGSPSPSRSSAGGAAEGAIRPPGPGPGPAPAPPWRRVCRCPARRRSRSPWRRNHSSLRRGRRARARCLDPSQGDTKPTLAMQSAGNLPNVSSHTKATNIKARDEILRVQRGLIKCVPPPAVSDL